MKVSGVQIYFWAPLAFILWTKTVESFLKHKFLCYAEESKS